MFIVLAAILVSGTAPDTAWCAPPRKPEPLMADAVRLGTSTSPDDERDRRRMSLTLVPRDSIVYVRDDAVCREAAFAYWSTLRRWVPDLFGSHPDAPVLVIALGSFFLVDDQRPRDDYWEVIIFDHRWRRLHSYGGGS